MWGRKAKHPSNPHQNSEGLWNTEGKPGGREDGSLSQKTWDVVGFAVNLVTFLQVPSTFRCQFVSWTRTKGNVPVCLYIYLHVL